MSSQLRFQRANYLVADLERSLRIYRDILGFEVEYIKDSPPDSYSYPVFDLPRDARLRFATLNAEGQRRTFALTEVRPAPGRPPRERVLRSHAIVLEVRNLDEVLARLRREPGVELIPEERLVTPDGRTGREIGFVDPDGHVVVLFRIDGA